MARSSEEARGVVLLLRGAREVERQQVLVHHRVVHVLRSHCKEQQLDAAVLGILEQPPDRAQRDVRLERVRRGGREQLRREA